MTGILTNSFCNRGALPHEPSSLGEGVGTVVQRQRCTDTTFSGNVWVGVSLFVTRQLLPANDS